VTLQVSERTFEETIESILLRYGPDAYPGDASGVQETVLPFGGAAPRGYRRRSPEEYDRALCLIPRDVLDFVPATQPKEWQSLKEHHGTEVKDRFLKCLSQEVERRGALDVLRNGIKDSGCKFRLAYFRPASALNEELQRLHAANLFAVVRQLRYSDLPAAPAAQAGKSGKSLDLLLFLNGIPLFTAELKNPLTGQTVEDAIKQYKTGRDPRERLFAYGRCLAHFAVDPDLVYVTTHLAGPKTRFLPFNQGKFGGAGNPPVPPTQTGYATGYLWERIWARDSALDLIRQFVHEVEDEDEQLDAVRRLVADARAQAVRNGLGDRASTCIDPKTQVVHGRTVCLVSCQRSPEPVFLKWKGAEQHPQSDFYVRSGPGIVKLSAESAREYIRTRFPEASKLAGES
jgi:type I restriction enzyme R subunit